jgi:hypothetical protein
LVVTSKKEYNMALLMDVVSLGGSLIRKAVENYKENKAVKELVNTGVTAQQASAIAAKAGVTVVPSGKVDSTVGSKVATASGAAASGGLANLQSFVKKNAKILIIGAGALVAIWYFFLRKKKVGRRSPARRSSARRSPARRSPARRSPVRKTAKRRKR